MAYVSDNTNQEGEEALLELSIGLFRLPYEFKDRPARVAGF
jgi:hypothetical protein